MKYWMMPGMSVEEAVELRADFITVSTRDQYPPCNRCGAKTLKEAEKLCRVSGGDDDDCHGCNIDEWHEWHTPLERFRIAIRARWNYLILPIRLFFWKRKWRKEAIKALQQSAEGGVE